MNAFDILMTQRSTLSTETGYSIIKGASSVKESECYLLQFDGLAQPNPGEASGGAILYSPSREPVYETGEYIKFATNNAAEYTGLIIGLRLALEKGFTKLLVEGDSQLIIFQSQGKSVLLAAGDTFRAAARNQLLEWGGRNQVDVIMQESGDAAAVAHDAIHAAISRKTDILIIDTAGRLATQYHLMEE